MLINFQPTLILYSSLSEFTIVTVTKIYPFGGVYRFAGNDKRKAVFINISPLLEEVVLDPLDNVICVQLGILFNFMLRDGAQINTFPVRIKSNGQLNLLIYIKFLSVLRFSIPR